MVMILYKSLGKRTSIGSYYDEKSLTKCYWDGVFRLFSGNGYKNWESEFFHLPNFFREVQRARKPRP